MPVLPVTHFEWQVLRTVKRGKGPQTGRALRLVPSRRTKDGSFLTDMVTTGLLTRASGTADGPFEATYSLTAMGEHAAEYGECDFPLPAKKPQPPAQPVAAKKRKSGGRSRA